MEKQVQRGKGADARSPKSSQEQAVFEAPNPELFGETAALGARGRRGGGGGRGPKIAVKRQCKLLSEGHAGLLQGLFLSAASLVFSAASLVLAKWIPLNAYLNPQALRP